MISSIALNIYNSIPHNSFIYTQVNGFMYGYVMPIVQFNISESK